MAVNNTAKTYANMEFPLAMKRQDAFALDPSTVWPTLADAQSYAKNNDRATFMLLFEKDFPNMAADRYEQNDQFFRKLFDDPDMMRQVMETVGSVLYERLKKKYIFDPKSGVIEEATPETYVEDTYLTKK